MKKLVSLLLVFCTLSTLTMAQLDKNRTVTTRIADLLAQLPADNAKKLEKSMQEVAGLGKVGIVQLATMLTPAGKGDNTSIQYAINGYTFYVSQSGKEELRKTAAEAYCEALGKLSDKGNQNFLIYQLQAIGKGESVATLKGYLKDEYLAGPAARALSKIGTSEAGAVLAQALSGASGATQLSLVEALGDIRSTEAVPAIEKLAETGDVKLKKVALYALAEIAAPTSLGVLEKAAISSGYTWDATNATASYLRYLRNSAKAGNKAQAEKAALALIAATGNDKLVHTRSAALKLIAETKGEASVPVLVSALDSKNSEYREAALKYAESFSGASTAGLFAKKLAKSSPDVQAEVLDYLGRTDSKSVLPAVLKLTGSKNAAVKAAAITAAGKIGGAGVLPNLFGVLKKGGATEAAAVKNALLTYKGTDLVDKVAGVLPSMPASVQPMLIDVLAARSADSKIEVVLDQLKSSNAGVKSAAFSALKSMATSKDLPALFTLLNASSSQEETVKIQEAISVAIKGAGVQSEQTASILSQMGSASEANKSKFLPVLASIGGKKALQSVVAAYDKGDKATQAVALKSLANWSNSESISELYKVGSKTSDDAFLNEAVTGYIKAVGKEKSTPEQKFLLLRKVFGIAKTTAQKDAIIQEMRKCRTFNAMIFAGNYLDDPQLQQSAAYVVMGAALSHPEYQGDVVRKLVNKTIEVLKGQDAEYQKESLRKHLSEMPAGEGIVSIFNGKDLTGWKGLVENPIKRAAMNPDTLAAKQAKSDAKALGKDWFVKDGELVFSGHGDNLCTVKKYGDFEMYVDWKIEPKGDAGIYLRGTPQVQIWDTSRVEVGAQVGSGGLYNNQKHPSKPTSVADNAIGDWNTFHIVMKGDRVWVDLNGVRVVDNVVLENFWDRKLPIFATEQLELQAHGTLVSYRDIYVREIPRPEPFQLSEEEKKEGFKVLFDGTNMYEWTGNTTDYMIDNGTILHTNKGGHGNLYTKDEYSDFVYRFEFQLTPGANNGLGIRAPLEGDAAYVGTELQILDDGADIYKNLQEYQYHGSAYGIIPAKRGYLKPVGEWNYEEVTVKGSRVKVVLNGTTILDGDMAEASKNGTLDHRDHPGLKRTSGHIGFLGHGSVVRFKNIRVKDLTKTVEPVVETKTKSKKKKK